MHPFKHVFSRYCRLLSSDYGARDTRENMERIEEARSRTKASRGSFVGPWLRESEVDYGSLLSCCFGRLSVVRC